ncbi:MAG: alanine:cation symporter family protein [Clostridia bacterium]|nr:alanine:cation symporter family protein [Clostridia bacterium]
MNGLEGVIAELNDALYGFVLIILLVASGIYFTVRTGFAQFTMLGAQIRAVTERPEAADGVSSFQALMVSTASRVGTGNIIGVAGAICIGGFGAVFWMWVIALIGGATSLIENTLAQIYKKRSWDGSSCGGPAYYIEQGLGCRWLGIVFSVLLILTYGLGFTMLTSYNLQSAFKPYPFYDASVTPILIGGTVAALMAYCMFGGGKRILKMTGVLVPVMGVAYILVALVVSIINAAAIPAVIGEIFRNAFDVNAIFGGFGGSCVLMGIKRGLFSNEAGVGSAPNASASADVSHPVKQGLVQILSVFIDTVLICSATAFMCMTSGVDASSVPNGDGALYVQMALSRTLGGFGPVFITVAMSLFGFTTLLGNMFYVEQCFLYIFRRKPGKSFDTCYRVCALLIVVLGAALSADLLWGIADITMGAMTLINIPVILLLGRYAFRAVNDYKNSLKRGKSPEFKSSSIGLNGLDYWN